MSAVLINGNGQGPITAAQDADWFAGLTEGKRYVLPIGGCMEASIEGANTVRVTDGVLVSQGRRIQIPAGDFEDFTIPNGSQGVTSYYIIGFKFEESGGDETVEPFVQSTTASGTIPEDSIRDGSTESYISLYRVTQTGLSVTATAPLFTKSGGLPPFSLAVVNGSYGYFDASGTFQSFKQATGNATAGQVLSGRTFSNSSALGITGTMPNRGAVTLTPSGNNTVSGQAGYYLSITADGRTAYAAGQNSRPNRGALTLTPTGNNTATAQAGYYTSVTADGRTSYAAGQAKGNGSYTVTLSGTANAISPSDSSVFITSRVSGSIVVTVTNGVARVTVNNLSLVAHGSYYNVDASGSISTSIS